MSDSAEVQDPRDRLALEIASAHGFAVPGESPSSLNTRRKRSKGTAILARESIDDLTRWLGDEDPAIRDVANETLQRILYTAYTAERYERTVKRVAWPTKLVRRTLERHPGKDIHHPWWSKTDAIRRFRRSTTVVSVLLAGGSAASFAISNYVLAVSLLALMAVATVADRAFAQATKQDSAYWPWFACMTGHFCDLIILGGLALELQSIAHKNHSALIAVSALAVLFATFVRVSALQAGYRFYLNPLERAVRWGSLLAYAATTVLTGEQVDGAVVLAAILIPWSIIESVAVIFKARKARENSGVARLLLIEPDKKRAYAGESRADFWGEQEFDLDVADLVDPHSVTLN